MVALGVGMDESMSSAAAVNLRIWRARGEFGSNRSYYTSKDVRLKDNFDKYAKHIVPGLLLRGRWLDLECGALRQHQGRRGQYAGSASQDPKEKRRKLAAVSSESIRAGTTLVSENGPLPCDGENAKGHMGESKPGLEGYEGRGHPRSGPVGKVCLPRVRGVGAVEGGYRCSAGSCGVGAAVEAQKTG